MATETEKPGKAPAAPADPVAELTKRIEELEAQAAKAVETFVSSTDLEKALETVVPAKVAEAIQAALAEASKPILEELEAKLAEITEAAGAAVDEDLKQAIAWAHAKIGALHVGVSRAIGVTITLPEDPADRSGTGDVTVTGTETADGLAK